MAKKNNIRSIRFSDEIMEMIEAQAGDNFTAKFEALVTRCMWELPAKEKELESIDQLIRERRAQLGRLSKKAEAFSQHLFRMETQIKLLSTEIAKAQEHEW